jgi:flagellar basal-body rod modification protein FlgD
MSIASTTAASTAGAPTAGAQGGTALTSLSANFGNFLKLLMTQLQNQDPTSPLDTAQFTTQLVQFSSVEQQINTNTSLTQLIQLTQAGELMQSSAMIGKRITVASDHVPLQNGTGTIQFSLPAAGPVGIAIYDESGTKIRDVSLSGAKGENSWTWDGTNAAGARLPDGGYKVAVTSHASNGTSAALPFSVVGTATGVISENNAVQLQLGALSVGFSAVKAVGL